MLYAPVYICCSDAAQPPMLAEASLEPRLASNPGRCGISHACEDCARLSSWQMHSHIALQVVFTDDMETGFSNLVAILEDLQLDVPEAVDLLARFILRAVTDEVLPPAFVKTIPGGRACLHREGSGAWQDGVLMAERLLGLSCTGLLLTWVDACQPCSHAVPPSTR